ncbi:D-glycero-beta-D-manno-heptose 1-phosphate adenylyltransferase [Candidatus Neomarinimicrobiota bacterium]
MAILTRTEVSEKIADWRKAGKSIVFTNGCFDIIHRGHIEYLKKAKALGDILVLGLNSDKSIKKLKGRNRPIQNQTDRAAVLDAIEVIDVVIIFSEETPLELIIELKPDILVKGGDYEEYRIVGANEMKQWDGSVVIIPYIESQSTSGIIDRVINKHNG